MKKITILMFSSILILSIDTYAMLRALSFARRSPSLSTPRRSFCNKGIKTLENEITALCNTRDTVNNIAQIYRESLHRCEYARNKLSWFEKNIPNLSERRTIDSDINWLGRFVEDGQETVSMLNDDIRKFQEALKIIKEEDRESKAIILSQREEIKKLQEQIKLQPIKE